MGSSTIISKLPIHNTKNVESIKPFWLLPQFGAVFGHVLSTFLDILVASWSLSVTNGFLDKRGQSDGSEMGSQRACLPATGASILTNLDHQQIQVAIHKYKSRWQSTNSNTNLGSQRACLPLGPCQVPQLPWMQVGWRTWLTGALLTNLDHQHIHVAIHKFKYKSRWQSTNTSPGDNSQIQIQI